MGYCPFLGLCRDRSWPKAGNSGRNQALHVACRARDDRRPWVCRRSSSVTTEELIVATEQPTIETKACAGARRHPLSVHLTKACTRQKSYVATDFSHDRPGGLGVQQSAHDARDDEVLVCDRASIRVIELSSSQKKKKKKST